MKRPYYHFAVLTLLSITALVAPLLIDIKSGHAQVFPSLGSLWVPPVPPTPVGIPSYDQSAYNQRLQELIVQQTAGKQTAWSALKNTITSVAAVTSSINDTAMWVKTYVLDPLAFAVSGNLLRSLTAGVVDFINGNNTSGRPLFVQNLGGHLLSVSDQRAFAFFAEFGRNSNTHFSAGLLSSLRANYLQGSSAAGFWAANQYTLPMFSPNPAAFVGGNFRQGGWPAWFALTTRPQNNPYMSYYIAQAEYSARVRNAVSNSLQELAWGDGFMSWCDDATEEELEAESDGIPESVEITPRVGEIPDEVEITNRVGTPGNCGAGKKTRTPASVIRDGLQKALGADFDRLIDVGDAGTVFQNIANTLQVMTYGASVLGAANSGGLLGISQPRGGVSSVLQRYRDQPRITQAGITNIATNYQQQAATQAQALGTKETASIQNDLVGSDSNYRDLLGEATGSTTEASATEGSVPYQAAWQTIGNAAQATRTSLLAITNSCPGTYVTEAHRAVNTVVNPLIQQAASAGANSIPTASNIAYAEAQAQTTNSATSTSCGSFTASGGTLVDQMTLIKANADKALSVCSGSPTLAYLTCEP